MTNFCSYCKCGYRKGFSTQHAILSLIEKWKKVLNNKGYGWEILRDYLKAFDSINHGLLIAKLHMYSVLKESLKLIKRYLTNRLQRTKFNKGFSKCSKILLGVPQGSVLEALCIISVLKVYFSYLKTLKFVTMQTTKHFLQVIRIPANYY